MRYGKFAAGAGTDVGAVLGEIPAASAGMTEVGCGCDDGGGAGVAMVGMGVRC